MKVLSSLSTVSNLIDRGTRSYVGYSPLEMSHALSNVVCGVRSLFQSNVRVAAYHFMTAFGLAAINGMRVAQSTLPKDVREFIKLDKLVHTHLQVRP